MPKPAGHRGCRTRELLLALSVDDVRRALDEASGEELAPMMGALNVQSRSAGRKAPHLLRARLRGLGHDACHDVACLLSQPLLRALERLLPDDDGDVAVALAAGPFDEIRRHWPSGLVALAVETLWHMGDLDLEARDRLLAAMADGGPPAASPLTGAADADEGPAPTATPVRRVAEPAVPDEEAGIEDDRDHAPPAAEAGRSTGAPAMSAARPVDAIGNATSALDDLLADAVARARTDSGRLAALRIALEELIGLDPARPSAWYHYGLVLAVLDDAPAGALQPVPGPARAAFVHGRLRGLADLGAAERVVDLVRREAPSVEALLARPEAGEVVAAVVQAQLGEPRAAAQVLDLVAFPFDGWQAVVAAVHHRVDTLTDTGSIMEAEQLLRAVEEALWRWASAPGGVGGRFEHEATAAALRRVACRRRRSDFVGAARLLASVDERFLAGPTRAAAACERALIGAELAGLEAVRFPRDDGERARLLERLRPVQAHLAEAVDADPGDVVAAVLLGLLLYASGETSAAPALAGAAAAVADRSGLEALAREIRFHAALARLRLLEPGTDEAAFAEMAGALEAGYTPGVDDLATAVVALEAHGSPQAGAFLAAALRTAPGAPALIDLLAGRARTGDEAACHSAEAVAADPALPLSVRFDLLDAALVGAGLRNDVEAAERLAGAVDDVLVRAGDASLDARFAERLGRDETLRLALDPATADSLRLEVLRRIGRIEEARAIALALFYRAAGGALRAFDPADLFHVLVELGLAPADLDDLARLLPSPPGGGEPGAGLDRPVHVLFVGGNETQDRYRAAVEASVAMRYDGKVRITWFLSGWRSNWHTDAARVEAAYDQGDVVVLMTFVRTHLGQRVRRSAGDAGLPWVACTGHGREAVERAIDRAVAVVGDRLASAR